MSDMPKSVHINEEGPREGFQIESGVAHAIVSASEISVSLIAFSSAISKMRRRMSSTVEVGMSPWKLQPNALAIEPRSTGMPCSLYWSSTRRAYSNSWTVVRLLFRIENFSEA